jgi:hypothetical protein
VIAGRCDLDRAPPPLLPANISEVGNAGQRLEVVVRL